MEEFLLRDGDLVPDGTGGFCRLDGGDALIQRILFKLTAKRGSFPFLPELGSLLHTLPREKEQDRQALCARYVAQALEGEDVTVTDVVYIGDGEQATVKVYLEWRGSSRELTLQIGGTTDEES